MFLENGITKAIPFSLNLFLVVMAVVNLKDDTEVKVSIINYLGQEVYLSNEEATSGIFAKQINLNDLANGFYMVNITTDDKIGSKKLIKQQ